MRGYLYRTAGPDVAFLECPFKGVLLARYDETGNGAELVRIFEKDWWDYYRWCDHRWFTPASFCHRAIFPPGLSEKLNTSPDLKRLVSDFPVACSDIECRQAIDALLIFRGAIV